MATARFSRLKTAPAYQQIHNEIERRFLEGSISADAPLPTETELSEQFGVTRHTVREGLRSLEQAGYLKRGAGRRLFMTLPLYDQIATQVSRAMILRKVTFNEVWEMSLDLEPNAAARAAERTCEAMMGRLEANVAETRGARDRREEVLRLDRAFHDLVAEASGNRVVAMYREPVSLLSFRMLDRLIDREPTAIPRLIAAHECVVAAIRMRDPERAREWMRKHIMDFKTGYLKHGLSIDEPVQSD